MQKDLLIETENGQTRLAVLEDGELCELYLERAGQEKLVGNIYMGRVVNILPGMQAAFVDVGLEKNGFLYAGDIRINRQDMGEADARSLDEALSSLSIRKMVRPGQEILVQVIKMPGGTKGPRLSSNVTLPGRMAVLLPTMDYVGVSRRIESEEERARLRTLADKIRPANMGLIVRTAAEGATEAQLSEDIGYLTRLWESILARSRHALAPALIHTDLSLVNRAVRDMLLPDVHCLKVDTKKQYAIARENAKMLSEALAEKVQLYEGEQPLFDAYRVDKQTEKALSRKVWLKSGGYLVIDYTEALTVIDVNTGKFVGRHSLSETVFQINCEAAEQIARQLRLRDIGGIIVIDFIDMEETEHREELLGVLRREMKKDRTKTNLVGLTGLGLVEMTRKKVHQPIHTLMKNPCPVCQGSGMVLSEETIARAALHALGAQARLAPAAYVISASQGVAGQLLLLGAPKGVKAYVTVREKGSPAEFEIHPALEHELPPKTRPLPPQQGDEHS